MKHGCRLETSGKGSSALCMWGMVSMAFLHACSLSLCPVLFFSSCQIPVYPPVCFIPPCLWWRSMVLHVLVKGLVVWGVSGRLRVKLWECKRSQADMWDVRRVNGWFRCVVSDQVGAGRHTGQNRGQTVRIIMRKMQHCPRVVDQHPPKPRQRATAAWPESVIVIE